MNRTGRAAPVFPAVKLFIPLVAVIFLASCSPQGLDTSLALQDSLDKAVLESPPVYQDINPVNASIVAPPAREAQPGFQSRQPGSESRALDWINNARKHYLSVFFSVIERESSLAALAFGSKGVLNVTSYDPDAVPLAGDYTGYAQIASWLRRLYRELDIHGLNVQYQLAEHPYVSSHVELSGTFRSSGTRVELEMVFVFTFSDRGFIESARMYYDTLAWTRAFYGSGGPVVRDIRDEQEDHRISSASTGVRDAVARVYDNFYAGNIPAVLELLSPDAAVYFKGDQTAYPYAGIYRGTEEILTFVQNLAGTAVPFNIEMFQITEGNRTDVVLFEEWTVFATGKSYHVHTVNSWKMNPDGMLLGFYNFPDSLEIAGAYVP